MSLIFLLSRSFSFSLSCFLSSPTLYSSSFALPLSPPRALSQSGRHALFSRVPIHTAPTHCCTRAHTLYLAPVPRPFLVSTGRCQFLVDHRLARNARSRYVPVSCHVVLRRVLSRYPSSISPAANRRVTLSPRGCVSVCALRGKIIVLPRAKQCIGSATPFSLLSLLFLRLRHR